MTNINRRRFPILLASALALLAILSALFLPHRVQAQSTTEIWSGTLTPGSIAGTVVVGWDGVTGSLGSIAERTFSYNNKSYTFLLAQNVVQGGSNRLLIRVNSRFDQAALSDLILVVDSDEFPLADASIFTSPTGNDTATWGNSGLSWSAGTGVSLSLKAITGRPTPTAFNVRGSGNKLWLFVNADLSNTLPPTSAFTLTAAGSPVTIGSISLQTNLRTLDLTDFSPLIGAGQTVTLDYTDPTTGDDTNAIQDINGLDAASFSNVVVNDSAVTLPKPTAAAVPADGATVALTFSETLLIFQPAYSSAIRNAFTVTVDGTERQTTDFAVSGATATLTMSDTIEGGQTVVVGYDRSAAGREALGTGSKRLVANFTTGENSVPAVVNNATAGAARLASAAVDAAGTRLTLTFNKSLNAESSARAWFTVTADGADVRINAFQGLSTASDSFTILFFSGSPIYKDESVVVVYEKPADSDGFTDEANDVPVASFTTGQDGVPAVTNAATTVAPPEPDTAASTSKVGTGGSGLVLAFDGPLATGNAPPASAFSITAGGVAIGVDAVLLSSTMTEGAVSLAGLTPKVRQGETVELTYTDPTSADDTNALQGTTGTDVHSFTVTVTNASTFTTGPPRPPTGLTATALGATIVDLAWTAPADDGDSAITGYKVEVSNTGSSDWSDLAADTGDANAYYRHTGLSDGNTRHYKVSAINANGTSPASGSANATTMTGTPHAVPGTIYGDVIWSAEMTVGRRTNIAGYDAESFDFTLGALSQATFDRGDGTMVTVGVVVYRSRSREFSLFLNTGLGAGFFNLHLGAATVEYDNPGNDISLIYDHSNPGWSHGDTVDVRLVEATAPAKPTGFTATAAGNAQIDLAWTAPADDGGRAVSGYKIEVSDDGSTGSWTDLVADTASTDTAYSHTGLSAGDTRHYQVSAINAVGTSDASDSKEATTQTTAPEPPAGVAAIADGTSKIVVSWSAPANDGGSAVTGYMIEVSTNGVSDWRTLVEDTTDTSYEHTGLSAGATRHYRVYATNAQGTSQPSAVVSDMTQGAGNTCTVNTAAGDYWCGVVTVALHTVGGFDVAYGYADASTSPNTSDTGALSDKEFTVGTNDYTIDVVTAGIDSNKGLLLFGLTSDLTAADKEKLVVHVGSRAFAFDDVGAPTSTSGYQWAMSGLDWSSWTSITLRLRRVPAAPGAPTNLMAEADGGTRIKLSWTAPVDNGGSAITGYRIEVSDDGSSGSWSELVADTDNADTSYTHTGLSPGDTRHYRVSAINATGTSEPSDSAEETTADPPTLSSATVNTVGIMIVLRFSENLDRSAGGTPPVSAFSVSVDGMSITVGDAVILGTSPKQVWLTSLGRTIYQGQAVTVTYTDPTTGDDAAAIQDSDGDDTPSFTTGEDGVPAVVNNSNVMAPADNNPPEFTVDQAILTVPENSAADTVVGTVTATDDDDDTLTYSLQGTDAASFDIDSGTGQIKTKANVDYNYEAKFDYKMTAKAADGRGGTDTIDVAIALLDDNTEKSAKPAKPTLEKVSGSSTTLDATWEKPDLNGGPDIAGYAVQYRQTGGSWRNFAHSGTGVTTTITGLTANTEYQVRVQAKNGEGDSVWSDASDAVRTNAVDIPIPEGLEVTLHLSNDEPLEDEVRSTFVTATVSPASPVAFTVTISASPVAPASGDDFELSNNRVLRFAADATESTGTVTIRPVDDGDPEPHDVVTVSGAVSNAAIPDPDDVTLTIRNDDADLPQDVAIDAPAAVEEDAGTAAVTVTITTRQNSAPTIDVDLHYRWQEGTATRGEDYTAPPGQVFKDGVLFATVPASAFSPNAAGTAWVAERSFTIGIINDREADRDETIAFYVTTGTYRSAKHTITIRDDDTPVLRNVRLVSGPGSDGVWSAGERVDVEVRYSLPVVVERPDCWPLDADGTCRPPGPYMLVAFRSDERPGYGTGPAPLAPYVGGSGTDTLTFEYAVGEAEDGALRVVVADNGMLLRGATIRPFGGGDAELSEYTNTRVLQVDVVKPGGGVWTAGDTVRVKVRFAGPVQYAPPDSPQNRDEVFVDERRGTPTIRLRLGEAPNPRLPRTARYESGSGTDTLTFEYEVRAGDGRVSVVEAVADSLARNGATIRNEDGYDAELNHVDVLWYSWLALRVRHATAREGGTLEFAMELARASQSPVTVDYETADGTATAGQDYTAKRGTVTFTPGRTRRTVEVPVLRDGKVEGVETMVLRLSNARSEGSEVPVEMKVSEAQGAIENVAPEVNTPATGVPTINGTAQVGETLTAGTSGIADQNGLENATFSYQWFADHAKIAGANSSTRTLTDVDQGKAIKVRVSFTDDAGHWETLTSAPTEPVLEETVFGDGPPGAPRNLTVTAGDQEVTLSWEPPADNGNAPATRYRIEWRIDGKDYGRSQWATSGNTAYTKTDLANGVKYVFRVKAENGTGNYGPYGPASEEVSATPTSGSAVDLGTPVLSNTKTLHHGMVKLDWEDVEDAGWYVVQYYHVKGGEWLDLPAAGVDVAFHGSSAVVSNLHGLSWLRVRAMSCAGESEWSQIEELYGTNASDWEGVPVPEVEEGDEIEPCPVVLGTPVLSNTETLHHGMVRLDWEDIEDAGWYVVQYYHVKGGEWLDLPAEGVDIAFHGSSAVVSNLHGLSWLRVGAASCDGASEWSQIEELYGTNASDWEGVPLPEVAEGDEIEPCPEDADTTDNSPATGAPAISGTAQVGETLTANTSGVVDADGLSNVQYDYQWLADDAAIAGATGSTYTLADTDEGKTITVQVSFTDDAGNNEALTSAATAAVAAAPTPNSPATGAPTISGTAQVGETLTADRSGIADADGLTNATFSYQWLADDAAIAGATGSTYTLADTDEGRTVKVQVTFTDDAGNEETLTSAATAAVAGSQPTEPPAKPRGLSATASHGSVTLAWDDPGDDTITGYVILRRVRVNNTGGDFSELVPDTGTAATTYTDDTVAAGTTYTYRIKAINGAGTSERSRWFHIDTPAAPVPGKPTGLSATASHDVITLTWEDPGDDSITGYVILRRLRYDDPSGHFDELVVDTGTAATTYTDDTVKANTHYTYRIKAINGAGVSERSRWFHIQTQEAP